MSIEFVDEPPVGRKGRFDWPRVRDALMERPGEWAKVAEWDRASAGTTYASNIKRGAMMVFRDGKWDAVGRSHNGTSALYMRYVGPS